jgi:exopolysaccharide biosynthesis predicted pyruvyltransferase EpsI
VKGGGNWGDELIWWGAEQLAADTGIDWTSVDFDSFMSLDIPSDAVIYIHGGGGFNRWSSGRVARAFVKAVTSHRGVVVQGPQTFDEDPGYFADLMASVEGRRCAERIVLYARELRTFGVLEKKVPEWLELHLDVDTALHTTRAAFLARAGIKTPRYDLYAAREDDEAPAGVSMPDLDAVRLDPARFATSFDHWLRIHAAARGIVTNRTHSAVAGAILEIPTVMLAGSYHKNRSFWEFALADRGVRWADYGQPLPFKATRRRIGLPGLLRRSWKVDRITKRWMGVPLS